MSITKRAMEGDPSILNVARPTSHGADYPFSLRGRRKNRLGGGGPWDPFWPAAVAEAIGNLAVASVNINGALRFRTKQDRDRVEARAEQLAAEALSAHEARRGQHAR